MNTEERKYVDEDTENYCRETHITIIFTPGCQKKFGKLVKDSRKEHSMLRGCSGQGNLNLVINIVIDLNYLLK